MVSVNTKPKMEFSKGAWRDVFIATALILVFIGLLFYANFQFVKAQPGGTDFLYRWLPTRLALLSGYENPYSPEVEYQVEMMHHGHAHGEGETPGIFAYPYYTMAVFLPLALLDNFLVARAIWMTLMELSHLGIVFLVLKILKFNPALFLSFSIFFISLFAADFAQALVDGNPSSLAAFFAVLALFNISRKKDILAGFFLALSTIKPQLVVLYLPFLMLWAFSRKRMRIIYATLTSLAAFLLISFLLQPGWLVEFYIDLTTYVDVARPSTPLAIMSNWMPESIAKSISLVLSLCSGFIIFRLVNYSWGKDFSSIFWAAGMIFVLMPLTGITSAKSNYVAMLPVVVLLVWVIKKKFKVRDLWLGLLLFGWVLFSWIFFAAGRQWMIGDTLIYFVDFYPLPLLLLISIFSLKPIKKPELLALD